MLYNHQPPQINWRIIFIEIVINIRLNCVLGLGHLKVLQQISFLNFYCCNNFVFAYKTLLEQFCLTLLLWITSRNISCSLLRHKHDKHDNKLLRHKHDNKLEPVIRGTIGPFGHNQCKISPYISSSKIQGSTSDLYMNCVVFLLERSEVLPD